MDQYPRLVLLLVLSCLCSATLAADRMMMEVTIAGRTAHLALDTAAEPLCLFDAGARRLGLEIEPPASDVPAAPGGVVPGRTEECDIAIGPNSGRLRLPVVPLPGYIEPDVDGLIGWDVLRRFVIRIDAVHQKVSVANQVPPEALNWPCWKIRPDARRLVVEIPTHEPVPETIMIDTGSPSGVMLAPQRWQQWTEAHPHQPATLDASFFPGIGIVVSEERWARTFALGEMAFHEVPVGDYTAMIQHFPGQRHAATLGLRAVRRLSWLIDAPNGKVYFQSHGSPAGPNTYEYNRLGAVFVPGDGQGDVLVAHVVQGGPAHRAGIRDGDRLLRIDELDVTKWRTDPRILPLSRFWSRPAGTALGLGLQRDEKTLDVTAVLEDIFPTRFGN
ncbi:MAG: PDZ domain-containing protein [Phycisphaerales bacterium]|nr:MAG: PDZ domain-containing protein [Phycisphaerales bacterium]